MDICTQSTVCAPAKLGHSKLFGTKGRITELTDDSSLSRHSLTNSSFLNLGQNHLETNFAETNFPNAKTLTYLSQSECSNKCFRRD